MRGLPPKFTKWFDSKGWSIHPHQHPLLALRRPPCQLPIPPPGGGHTMAGFLPTLPERADAEHKALPTLYPRPPQA